jgi:phosphohistidine phosphatase
MALNLLLLRHAKSSWAEAGQADHDRPLNGRGQAACARVAAHFRQHGLWPELALCSTARRTRQTLALLGAALGWNGPVRHEESLYLAPARTLLHALRSVNGAGTVLLVGHNPGLQELAIDLADEAAARPRLAGKFPTAALAEYAVPGDDWSTLSPGAARLVRYTIPAELDD